MHSDSIVISVRDVTKTYRMFRHPGDRIKQAMTLGLKKYHKEFTAVTDISFDIKKGEAIGIIGQNGSGKSTLLQLICGILKPTAGVVDVNGRVSTLLELGAGFNPEFTGRENVYFQGALMGLSKVTMAHRFEEIEAFADIGEFIDQPVRTYSSGMFVRLAFAVAIHVDPEILIIDEALAVGDYEFQLKCKTFLQEFREQRGTMLLVSHDINIIRALCDRAIYLRKERECQVGPVDEVSNVYLSALRLAVRDENAITESIVQESSTGNDGPFMVNAEFARRVRYSRQGTGDARITAVELQDEKGKPLLEAEFGQCAIVRLYIHFYASCEVLAAYFIGDELNKRLLGSSTQLEGFELLQGVSGDRQIVEFTTQLPFTDGSYSLTLQLSTPLIQNVNTKIVDYVENAKYFKVMQHFPVKIWSKVYVKNAVSVTKVDQA